MPRGRRKSVHRSFYPNARKGQPKRDVKPVIKADPVITTEGVKIVVLDPERSYTPDELKMMASWLYALSHEVTEVAAAGLISEGRAYDVSTKKVVSLPAS